MHRKAPDLDLPFLARSGRLAVATMTLLLYASCAPQSDWQECLGETCADPLLHYRLADGWRWDGRSQEPPGAPLVLALGSSTTYGWQVTPERSWPAVLDRRLRGVAVVSMAVPYWTSAHMASALLHQGLAMEPDIVVVSAGWTDAVWRAGWPSPNGDYFEVLKPWVGEGEALTLKAFHGEQVDGRREANWASSSGERFARNIRSIVDLSEGVGARVVVVLQPLHYPPVAKPAQREWVPPEMAAEHGQIAREAAGSATIVDASGLGEHAELFLYPDSDPAHLSPLGYARLATEIQGALQLGGTTPPGAGE